MRSCSHAGSNHLCERHGSPDRKVGEVHWLRKLKDRDAKAKIEAHLDYCELKGSLLGDTKPVGDSIYEMRFHFGPGYRIYYARSGSEIYLLLIGGDKRKQQADIKKAKKLFREYSE